MNELHRRAEALASEAGLAADAGRIKEAGRLFSEAADLEFRVLAELPPDRVRTRSILAVSAVSLLYKAGRLDEAELACFRILGSGELNSWGQAELRSLLEVVTDERLVQVDLERRYSDTAFTVSLRGGAIGSGTGPLDVILNKTSAIKNLIVRFAEWVGDQPLRIRGSPPKVIQELIQARVTQPAAGSFRMEIRLMEPVQPDLFDEKIFEIGELSDSMFGFLHLLVRGRREDLEAYIPDEGYRRAFLDLAKSVAPKGKRVKEVGIYRARGGRVESVYMTSGLPERIREFKPQEEPSGGEKWGEVRGVLRALHLDRNWLEVTIESGEHVKCDTVPDMLDDLVGPMVNNPVVVRGPIREKYKGSRLLVEDIEVVED